MASIEVPPDVKNMVSKVEVTDLGIMGTGTNMFRCGLAHSSGQVFIGTYGPAPAIIWQYNPESQKLRKIAAPGEYQLDCMVEAPNGKIYIGTAYSGLVYELDPFSGTVTDLGSPPVESTPWIFTMICTRDGEIFGAKGVGLFHLDWRTGRMESCGTVLGNHESPGSTSAPIIRSLEERPDGLIWGDTNRWIFLFDPKSRSITPVSDVAAYDDACYAVLHSVGASPHNDLYFQIYSRFSGRVVRNKFAVCRAATGLIEPLQIDGLSGDTWPAGWWMNGTEPYWLVSHLVPEATDTALAVVDVLREKVVDQWEVEGRDTPPNRCAGAGEWFFSGSRGTLFCAEPEKKQLTALAKNPVPTECRCLAATAVPETNSCRLGTDTYDCGFVFTRDLPSEQYVDQGRVWIDDHRCNYGPAAFAGEKSEFFLANHGEEKVVALWATELGNNRHWRVGDSAIQLLRLSDGTVWGTQGDNPPAVKFDSSQCWTPAWHSRPGKLFCYRPGAKEVELASQVGEIGPVAESPMHPSQLLLCAASTLRLYDTRQSRTVGEWALPDVAVATTTDLRRGISYILLADGRLSICSKVTPETLVLKLCDVSFRYSDRGFFVLPKSGRLVGINNDGKVSVFDPESQTLKELAGTAPLPAGPAVDPSEDAWYFADRHVVRYSLR